MNLWTIFITGLFTGGLTCLAVQGGLLAATITQREQQKLRERTQSTGSTLPILMFLTAKLVAYTILGFLLGLLGSAVQLSLTATIILQATVALFMIGTALDMLEVHPIFRFFVIQPPKFLFRLVRQQSKSAEFFAPALLGAFTVFVPCGTTQAMMALAISTGSPFLGALTLAVFVLGTSPLFFLLGFFTTKLSGVYQQNFMKIAAFAVIVLALFNLNGAISLTGTRYTPSFLLSDFLCTTIDVCTTNKVTATAANPVSEATITIGTGGYTPNTLAVRTGSKVTLHLKNTDGGGCAQAFTIPAYNIQRIVTKGQSDTVEFTAPDKPGQIRFMCSMGMYDGVINVISS